MADHSPPVPKLDQERPRAGRPRDAALDSAILDATEQLLMRDGYDGLTIEAVAERAGVSRPTIYRRWSDKAHLVLAAVASHGGAPSIEDSGSLRGDLQAVIVQNAQLLDSAVFRRTVPALLVRLSSDEAVADAYAREFVDLRRSQVVKALERAVGREELQSSAGADSVFDLLVGPLFYRVIVRRERITDGFLDLLLESVMANLEQ